MSLIFTQPVVGTTPSDILTHCSKIPADNTSSMYKTEMDLGLVRPHAHNAFRLVHLDSIPGPSHENPPAACVISSTDGAADAVESSMSAPSEGSQNESEVNVETESVGKISDLITRFNGAESRALDIKIPAKKFRIDLQNVHTRYNTTCVDRNGAGAAQGEEEPLIKGSESSRLPVVQMKFKFHTQTVNYKHPIVESNISKRPKQLVKMPPTPAPKPIVMKNCGIPTAVICPPNTVDIKNCGIPTAVICPPNTVDMKNYGIPTAVICQSHTEPSEIHCVRPSEVRKVFPFANIEFPRTDKSGVVGKTREYQNGRNIYCQPGVAASQCNQSEHKLIQSQHRDAVDHADMLPKGISEERTIFHKDETLSTDNPQEEALKESVTFSMEEKQQQDTAMEERLAVSEVKSKQNVTLTREYLTVSLEEKQKSAVSMKPAISPRHIDINTQMADNNRKLVTKDVTPVSVVTLDSGRDNGSVTVKNEMGDLAISTLAGNISKSGDSKHGNMADTQRLVFGCVDQTSCTDSSVGCCTQSADSNVGCCTKSTDSNVGYRTADTDTTVGDTSMDANFVGCPTSTNSNVCCCTTSTDSGVHGCTTSIDASIDVCPSSTECNIGGYPTSSEPIVDGCKISKGPSAHGFTPSTDSTLSEYSTASVSTVSEYPTSSDSTVSEYPTSSDSTVSEYPTSSDSTVSEYATWTPPCVAGHPQKGHNADGNTISAKLDMLKTELMAMRKMDLVLLRQLINISQAIQRIHRSDLPKMSRSLTILSSKKTLQPRFKPVERQNSAPHCADRRRFLFSNAKWRTEDDYRDSLSSFEESSFDSQSELEESSSSLNNTLSSPRSFDCPRILFQSCNIPLSLDISEEVDQSYEDILSRNVRLWKMGFQRHQSVQEKVDVWF